MQLFLLDASFCISRSGGSVFTTPGFGYAAIMLLLLLLRLMTVMTLGGHKDDKFNVIDHPADTVVLRIVVQPCCSQCMVIPLSYSSETATQTRAYDSSC